MSKPTLNDVAVFIGGCAGITAFLVAVWAVVGLCIGVGIKVAQLVIGL